MADEAPHLSTAFRLACAQLQSRFGPQTHRRPAVWVRRQATRRDLALDLHAVLGYFTLPEQQLSACHNLPAGKATTVSQPANVSKPAALAKILIYTLRRPNTPPH